MASAMMFSDPVIEIIQSIKRPSRDHQEIIKRSSRDHQATIKKQESFVFLFFALQDRIGSPAG
ncbi:hypothetical protein FXW07_02455 [Methanosarcina sp. DH1]|uniref:hypothetical protein n=1 Tax=Methanosarcina sp. DH1 TaxID=2605695 RepID=UPI001E39F3E3|nr:hypothetical protein [Methanosarcina sp. DH1]MCC4765522.1 hypothetical protein [Methanosarcina sp. DH1]